MKWDLGPSYEWPAVSGDKRATFIVLSWLHSSLLIYLHCAAVQHTEYTMCNALRCLLMLFISLFLWPSQSQCPLFSLLFTFGFSCTRTYMTRSLSFSSAAENEVIGLFRPKRVPSCGPFACNEPRLMTFIGVAVAHQSADFACALQSSFAAART